IGGRTRVETGEERAPTTVAALSVAHGAVLPTHRAFTAVACVAGRRRRVRTTGCLHTRVVGARHVVTAIPRRSTHALASRAIVCDGAGVAIGALGAVDLHRLQAGAGLRITGGRVTLVGRCADDRIGTPADTRLTRVGLRAGVAVVARAAVGLGRVRA